MYHLDTIIYGPLNIRYIIFVKKLSFFTAVSQSYHYIITVNMIKCDKNSGRNVRDSLEITICRIQT